MALNLADRVLTVAVTATLTSAAWIVGLSGADREAEPPGEQPEAARATSPRAAPPVPATVPAGQGWLIPVAGVESSELIDTFDDARGAGERRHEALDIAAPAGTAVLAAAPGKVEKLFLSDDGGNTIYIRSADGRTLSYYAHLQAYEPGLREGAQVTRGQRLGTVGSSGNADPAAPHLHFAILRTTPDAEWWDPAVPINPYPLLLGSRTDGQSAEANR